MKKLLLLILLIVLSSQVTIRQVEQCLELNCPETCPDEGEVNKCQEELTEWEKLFQKESKSDCLVYKEELGKLKVKDDNQQLTQEVLDIWGRCYSTWQSVKDIDTYVGKYIAQCENSCVTKGENPDDKSFEKTVKGLYKKCKDANCKANEFQACQNDTDCKILLDKYSECQKGAGNNQCIKANLEFESVAEDALLPYSWYACQESCKIYTDNKLFNAAIGCEAHCQKVITVLQFSRKDLETCQETYAPSCPNYEGQKQECDIQLLIFKDRMKCDTCNFDEKVLAGTELAKFLPKSCSDCILQAHKVKQDDKFQKMIVEIYLPVINSCAVNDNIKVLQRQVTATIEQYNECIKDAQCKDDDIACKENGDKFQKCQRQSSQCSKAIEKLENLELDPKQIYPYEMVICKESCFLNGNQAFEEIQKTWETCEVYKEPAEPEFQPFSEGELRICIETNVPLCGSKDLDCKKALKSIEDQKLNDKDCKQCEKDKKHPNAEGKVPLSCTRCEFCELKEDGFPSIINNFYIPARKACYTNVDVSDLQKKFNVKVKDELECQKKCRECDINDKDCINADQQFEDCIKESNQCKQAEKQYQSKKPNDQYPYSLIACEESCKNKNSAGFNEIQKCWDTCLTYDPDPEVLSFDYKQFTSCITLNVPECSKSDNKCQEAVKQINSNREKDVQCEQCEFDYKDKRTNGKMPISCVKCEEKSKAELDLEYKKILLIYNFYLPARIECAQKGKVQGNKATIKQHSVCFEQCEDCTKDQAGCSKAKGKYEQCKKASIQCQVSLNNLKDMNETEPFPFSEVACEESCKNEDDEAFNKIQQCWERCVHYEPEVPPEFLEFSYQDYKTCIELNQPDCNLEDQICRQDFAKITKMKSKIKSCNNCNSDIKHETAKGRMPLSCQKCDLEVIIAFENDGEVQNPKIISTFIIPAIQNCAESANVEMLQKKYNKTIVEYNKCSEKCPTCKDDDNECNKATVKFTECIEKSEQCKSAKKYLETLKPTDIYPFSMMGCQESCLNNISPNFIQIFQCKEKCANYNEDLDVEVKDFEYESYKTCIDHYVADCADYDQVCIKNKTTISSRKIKYDECETCDTEVSYLENKKQKFNYPISCSQCQVKISTPEKSDIFSESFLNFVLDPMHQCASKGKVTEVKRKIDATIGSFNNCVKGKCGDCNHHSGCTENKDKYNKCIQKSHQCSFAINEYQQELYNPFPYSYLICQDSCKILDDQDFAKILDCTMNCQQNSYERKNFTYQDYGICLNVSLPSPQKDSKAYQDKELMKSCLKDGITNSCQECRLLSENDGEEAMYPTSCSLCVNECLNSQKDRKLDDYFKTYIISAYSQCRSTGNYDYSQLPLSIHQKKEQRENCLKNLSSLPCEGECEQLINITKECKKASWQCKDAEIQYGLIGKQDLIPASLEICRLGCIPDEIKNGSLKNNQFITIQDQNSNCNLNTSQYQNFTTKDVNKCVKEYVPTCPDWDHSCKYAFGIIEKNCYESDKSTNPICQECHEKLREKVEERDEEDRGKHPKACQKCMEDCLESFQTSDSYVMRHLIVTNLRSCHSTSTIKKESFEGDSTISSTTACLKSLCRQKLNCGFSKDKGVCLNYFRNYTRCQSIGQCSIANNLWSTLSSNQSSLEKVPVEKLICNNACEPRDAEDEQSIGRRDFFQIISCNDYCFTSGYKPDVKPDDKHDDVDPPAPKPEEKKDGKNSKLLGITYLILSLVFVLFF